LILHSVQPCGHVYIPDETSSRIQSFPDETKNVKLNKGAREVSFNPRTRVTMISTDRSISGAKNPFGFAAMRVSTAPRPVHTDALSLARERERTHTKTKENDEKSIHRSPSSLSRAYTSVKTSAIRVTTTRAVEPGNYPGRARVNQ